MAYFLVVLKAGPAVAEEARVLATEDPNAIHHVYVTETVEWLLVGIDPKLIDSTSSARR